MGIITVTQVTIIIAVGMVAVMAVAGVVEDITAEDTDMADIAADIVADITGVTKIALPVPRFNDSLVSF